MLQICLMTNSLIADNFSLLSKLMDIHGENSFKAKSYSIAAFAIDQLTVELSSLPKEKIFALKNIGEATGKKVLEQLETGQLLLLNEYLEKTPAGVVEMLRIKGLGPKKIGTIWRELEIETIGELLYACNENRLSAFKGFGEKTQNNIRESIEFYLGSQGSFLYAQLESYVESITNKLKSEFSPAEFLITGNYRRQAEVLDKVEWVADVDSGKLKNFFEENEFTTVAFEGEFAQFKGPQNVALNFYFASKDNLFAKQFETTAAKDFLLEWNKKFSFDYSKNYSSEEAIFEEKGLQFIPAFIREDGAIIEKAEQEKLPVVIQPHDITAIIHSHSKWSDGGYSIEEMAKAAIKKGMLYLVISDHSKSAFYASGLTEERIKAQHEEIDELNKKLAPFRIFKSIESDILNDGSLDYDNGVLETFDLVITSIHSNLKMSEEKAMMRLLRAIENPYTNILGHMTGRLLLSRNGYPVDHKKIIDACAAHDVVIELNANPRRLDMDYKWIPYALEKNVLISIDPDAHSIAGFEDIRYGVLVAQKAGLTKERNLSSFSLAEFEAFLKKQHQKRR